MTDSTEFFRSFTVSRIFMSLSLLPLLLVLSTMGVGWWIGDYNGVFAEISQSAAAQVAGGSDDRLREDLEKLREPQRRFNIHFQLGLASSLAVVLINSLSVTYLIGTSRWIKEVCEAYSLDEDLVKQSTKLKRTTFPWSIAGVVAILAIVAMGAAADPGTIGTAPGAWVTPHMVAALIGTSVIVVAIVSQAVNLHRNSQIIEDVVNEVQRERAARGLATE